MPLEIEFTGPSSHNMMTAVIGDPLAPRKPKAQPQPADKPAPKLKPKGKRGKR